MMDLKADRSVMTVLGKCDPGELGITDAHTHIWIDDLGVARENAPVLDDPEHSLEELEAYKIAGGASLADCQPGGCGRDGNRLRELSRLSGVKILACTGFHLEEYYPEGHPLFALSPEDAAEYFLAEINLGLRETRDAGDPVYPGFIKIAVRETLGRSPQALIEGAVLASLASGSSIEMHTQRGLGVEEVIEYLLQLGLPLDRLVICHIDKRPDSGLHRALAETGCVLEYDTFFRKKYDPERHLWPLLREMVAGGFAGSIACATDLADRSLWWAAGGGPGLAAFLTVIKKRLDDEIADPGTVERLLGGNIAVRLAR